MRGKRLWDSLGGLDKVGEAVVEASCMSVTRAGVVVFHLCAGWLLLRVAAMLDLSWNHGDGTGEDGLRVEACGSFHCFLKNYMRSRDRICCGAILFRCRALPVAALLPRFHPKTRSGSPDPLTREI